MQIESIEGKRDDGRRGSIICAQCASNRRGAMECTQVPGPSPCESSDPQGKQMRVLEGTQKSGESILE